MINCRYDEETEIIVQRIIRSHKQAVIAEMESALYKGPKKKESRLLRVLQGVTGLFMSRALRSAHLEVSNVHVVWCSGDWDSQVDRPTLYTLHADTSIEYLYTCLVTLMDGDTHTGGWK